MTGPAPSSDDRIVDDPEQVVIRDKRRLDPESGTLREPAVASVPEAAPVAGSAEDGAPADGSGAGGSTADDRVAELTADLQRISAEYANYRKRVERDRLAVVEMATAGLLSGLLPVLDDIERARAHGDLTGGFLAVGEALEALTAKLGVERFGEVGEPFDPTVHEALMQAADDPTASVAVCAAVLQPGYRMAGGRVLRPARVSVAEPAASAPAAAEH